MNNNNGSINPEIIILGLKERIKINTNAKEDLDNLTKNLMWTPPELLDRRFWYGHECRIFKGLIEILIQHFTVDPNDSNDITKEKLNVQQFYKKCCDKYQKSGFVMNK